jgi:hypothetical protein
VARSSDLATRKPRYIAVGRVLSFGTAGTTFSLPSGWVWHRLVVEGTASIGRIVLLTGHLPSTIPIAAVQTATILDTAVVDLDTTAGIFADPPEWRDISGSLINSIHLVSSFGTATVPVYGEAVEACFVGC